MPSPRCIYADEPAMKNNNPSRAWYVFTFVCSCLRKDYAYCLTHKYFRVPGSRCFSYNLYTYFFKCHWKDLFYRKQIFSFSEIWYCLCAYYLHANITGTKYYTYALRLQAEHMYESPFIANICSLYIQDGDEGMNERAPINATFNKGCHKNTSTGCTKGFLMHRRD